VATVIERFRSRSGTYGASGSIQYAVTGVPINSSDRATVYALVMALAPATLADGLWRHSPELDNQGGGTWYATVPYKPFETPESGKYEWRLNIGTRSMRITHSLETISKTAPAGQTAPDYKGAINVVDGERVDGLDRALPEFSWEEDLYIAMASVTTTLLNTIYGSVATTNDGTWRFFDAGEVLFLGCSGAPVNADLCKFTFRFAAEPNLTDIAVGDAITVPSKKGHEYLWVAYAPAVDATAKRLVRQPMAAYVERIYEESDFSAMGLPDPWA
jgi:hypothetical protein